jgi:hypothetical protein
MRGAGGNLYDSRRPFPVSGTPKRAALIRSCIYPRRIPRSMRTVAEESVPSSSKLIEPRSFGIVPLSITVTRSLATLWPTRFV